MKKYFISHVFNKIIKTLLFFPVVEYKYYAIGGFLYLFLAHFGFGAEVGFFNILKNTLLDFIYFYYAFVLIMWLGTGMYKLLKINNLYLFFKPAIDNQVFRKRIIIAASLMEILFLIFITCKYPATFIKNDQWDIFSIITIFTATWGIFFAFLYCVYFIFYTISKINNHLQARTKN